MQTTPSKPDEAPTVEQLRQLREVVRAIAERKKYSEPMAYVWLCRRVFAGNRCEPTKLTRHSIQQLIDWRLTPAAT